MKKSGSIKELAPTAAKKAVDEGLAAFQAGRWDKAADQFGKAVDQGAAGGGADFARQALQLFVAARLLAAAADAVKKQPGTAARLARFALPLLEQEPGQRVAAVGFAVEANMAAKNFG